MPRKLGTAGLLDPQMLESIVGGRKVAPQLAQPAQPAQPKSQYSGPGMSGLLADLAQVFAAKDPQSWQAQLGRMVATKATTDVFAKYTKNLEDIISGEAEPGTAMAGITPLEQQRISPEQRALSLEEIISGEKMRQAGARIGLEAERVEALKGYYEDIGGYYEFLQTKTPEERERFVTTEVGAGEGMRQKIAYNLDTKESTVLGEPYAVGAAPTEGMPPGQRANLIRGLERDSLMEAKAELATQGIMQPVRLADGSLDYRWVEPKADLQLLESARRRILTRKVTQQLDAGTIDMTTANAILGVDEPAMTPDKAQPYRQDKTYQAGEFFIHPKDGTLQQWAPDLEHFYPAGQGGKQ